MNFNILIVEDEKNIRNGLSTFLKNLSYDVFQCSNGLEALEFLRAGDHDIDAVISDLKMPVMSGQIFLEHINKEFHDKFEIIMITGHGTIENAVQIMQNGASDFLTKPINLDHLAVILNRIKKNKEMKLKYQELQEEVNKQKKINKIIGSSPHIKEIIRTIEKVAPSNASVLINGESGVGKEVVANAIHDLSKRSSNPFIKVHCAALNENLLESELFGHEKGAFTGANSRKIGRFEMADKGTIFLDEIGEISPTLQVKLLRVLQEKVFERVGGQDSLKVDIRLISATNKNLEEEIVNKKFREDLYYRLNVIKIEVLPLRERQEDIAFLFAHFLKEFSKENEKEIYGIDDDAMDALYNYSWPGNIRELRNYVENAVVMCKGSVLKLDDFPPIIKNMKEKKIVIPIGITLKEAEKIIIDSTLFYYKNNKSKAASVLGIERKTLYKKTED